jgi:hypothetical protein
MKPALRLVRDPTPKDIEALYRQLTGKEPTAEEKAEVERILGERSGESERLR